MHDSVRDEFQLNQKNVLLNGRRFGCVYSLKMDLGGIPDEFQYHLTTRIWRTDAAGITEAPYRQIGLQVKLPRELPQASVGKRATGGWIVLVRASAYCR